MIHTGCWNHSSICPGRFKQVIGVIHTAICFKRILIHITKDMARQQCHLSPLFLLFIRIFTFTFIRTFTFTFIWIFTFTFTFIWIFTFTFAFIRTFTFTFTFTFIRTFTFTFTFTFIKNLPLPLLGPFLQLMTETLKDAAKGDLEFGKNIRLYSSVS